MGYTYYLILKGCYAIQEVVVGMLLQSACSGGVAGDGIDVVTRQACFYKVFVLMDSGSYQRAMM